MEENQLVIRKLSDFELKLKNKRSFNFEHVSIFMKWKDSIEKIETKKTILKGYLDLIKDTIKSIHLDFRDNYLNDVYIPVFSNFLKVS